MTPHPHHLAGTPPPLIVSDLRARVDEWQHLRAAYDRHGGLADSHHLLGWCSEDDDPPLSRMARGIVAGEVVHLAWHSALWIPLFQFEWPSLRVRPGVQRVMDELGDLLEPWRLAQWFVTPHPMLDDRVPAAVLRDDDTEVVNAARADRFVLRG